MVEKLKNIAETIEREKGKLTVFAAIKMDELVDSWSIVFSADWINVIDDDARKSNFGYIFSLLEKELTADERQQIARIGIFPRDYYLIRELCKFKPDAHVVETTKINGNIIHEARIIRSQK